MPAPVAVCIVSAVGLLAAVYVFKEVRTLVKDRGSVAEFVIAPMLEDLAVSYLERRRKQQASSATTSPGSTPVELNQLTPREDTRSQSTRRHRQTTGVMEESDVFVLLTPPTSPLQAPRTIGPVPAKDASSHHDSRRL